SSRNGRGQLGQIAKIVSAGPVEIGGFNERAARVLQGDRDIPQPRTIDPDHLVVRAVRNSELIGAGVYRWWWRVVKEIRVVEGLYCIRPYPCRQLSRDWRDGARRIFLKGCQSRIWLPGRTFSDQ